MKTLYFDAFSGVSGDKTVAALLSIGGDKKYLLEELKKLDIDKEYEIKIYEKDVMGINAIKFDVILKVHEHHHRGLSNIKEIINNSAITEKAKKISIGIFEILAKAEAKIHNKTVETIHFHEVGAIDSIIDIVSVGVLIDYLKIDKIFSSKIALGKGFVKAAHGTLPVPVPATAEILKDIPVYQTEIETELTTPTGASIIKHLVDNFIDVPNMTFNRTGYGAGSKDLNIPNLLRMFVGELLEENQADIVLSLETNLDDCSPEQIGFLYEKLFNTGALDVYITPVFMKKNRQGQLLTVICKNEDKIKLEEIIFLNSTTFGIRSRKMERSVLKRKIDKITVDGIDINIKLGWYGNKLIQSSLEYESVKKAINKLNISYNDFVKKANSEMYSYISELKK